VNMGAPMPKQIFVKNTEPTVAELLADPIMHLILNRDRLQEGDVLAVVARAKETIRRSRKGSVNVPAAA
jgi:hypothetical protein